MAAGVGLCLESDVQLLFFSLKESIGKQICDLIIELLRKFTHQRFFFHVEVIFMLFFFL